VVAVKGDEPGPTLILTPRVVVAPADRILLRIFR